MFSKGYVGMLWNSFLLFAFHTLQSAPINGFFSEATGRIHLCTFGECFFNLFVEFIDFFLILNSLPFPVNVYVCFFSQYLFNAMWLRQFHITHGRCEFTRNYLNILLIKKNNKNSIRCGGGDEKNETRGIETGPFLWHIEFYREGKRNAILDFNKLKPCLDVIHICKRYIDCLHP